MFLPSTSGRHVQPRASVITGSKSPLSSPSGSLDERSGLGATRFRWTVAVLGEPPFCGGMAPPSLQRRDGRPKPHSRPAWRTGELSGRNDGVVDEPLAHRSWRVASARRLGLSHALL